MKIISSSKYLQIVPVWYQSLSNIIYLLWFLWLSSSLREDDIGHDIEHSFVSHISLDADQASLLGVLKVEAMTFSNFPVDCLLDPCDFIDKLIAELVEYIEGKSVLSINDPNEEKALSLDLVKWNIENLCVC